MNTFHVKIMLSTLLILLLSSASYAGGSSPLIAAGSDYSCALTRDGLKCWGLEPDRYMGPHRSFKTTSPPPSLRFPTQISAAKSQVCAIDEDGVKCWGIKVNDMIAAQDVTQISIGEDYYCWIRSEQVECMRTMTDALAIQYGKPDFEQTKVPPLNHPTQVVAGWLHTCAIDQDGVQCWGANNFGQTDVPRLHHPTQVAVGRLHTCAIDQKRVKCWGENGYGQTNVPALRNPIQIAAGNSFTCALDRKSVKCWGYNGDGQTDVPPLDHPTQITVGENHACAFDKDGVHCWGKGDWGQTQVPSLNIGMQWRRFEDTPSYLDLLSEHVYSFDREYFKQVGVLTTSPDAATFAIVALIPHLQNLGYSRVDNKYVTPNLERLRDALRAVKYTELPMMGDRPVFRRLSLQMLAISLKTAIPILTATQRAEAEKHLALLAKVLTTDLTNQDLKQVVNKIQQIENLLTEMSRNPYLTGRMATALGLTHYLAGI